VGKATRSDKGRELSLDIDVVRNQRFGSGLQRREVSGNFGKVSHDDIYLLYEFKQKRPVGRTTCDAPEPIKHCMPFG
jgi:hypothetical protein